MGIWSYLNKSRPLAKIETGALTKHIRFEDRAYAGESQYRKGEGWIDVYSIQIAHFFPSVDDAKHKRSGVTCLCVKDRSFMPLFRAGLEGRQVGKVVFDIWAGKVRERFTLTDTYVNSCKLEQIDVDDIPGFRLDLHGRLSEP